MTNDGVSDRPYRTLAQAAALGAVCGMRSFGGPAALALRGRIGNAKVRNGLVLMEVGEIAADKYPGAPSRSEPAGLAARIATGAGSGHVVGGVPGACVAGIIAALTTFGAERARRDIGIRAHVPDAVVAVAEDALMIGLAFLATSTS
jgi:uncharacterized membrane protein